MSKIGYISLHRRIQEHWLWTYEEPFDYRSAWIDLLMMSNWQDGKEMIDGDLQEVKRGQLILTEVGLAKRWKWSRGKVKRYLELLASDGMISVEKRTYRKTLVTIENYEKFQSGEAQTDIKKTSDEHQTDIRRTSDEHQTDIHPYINKLNKTNKSNKDNQDKDLMSGKPDGTDEEMLLDDPSCEDETRTDDTIETTRKSESKPSEQIPYKDIIEFLNETTGKGFKYTSKATQSKIHARWQEGFRLEDFKRVVLVKSDQWRTDPRMSAYLRPDTLFGTKFESYLNETNQQPRRGGLDANTTSQYTTVDGYDPRAQRTSYGRDRKLPRLEDITKLYEERALERARDVQGGAE